MPASCEPAELIENARFLDCCIPKGMQMAVLILLFGELIDMPSDADTLLQDAKCLDQCIPDGAKMSVLISLACQIVEQGGTGGGGTTELIQGNYGGNIPPVSPTTFPVQAKDLDTGLVWWWDGTNWI